MNYVKQIHKLHQDGYGAKTIATMLGIARNTVKAYLRKARELELTGEQILATDNPILADQLKPVSSQEHDNYQAFLQRAEHYVQELSNRKRTHVTRMILWEEDFQAGRIGMRYSRFCFHLRRYLKSKQPSMVMVHHPGEKMFIDFAGDKLYYIDRNTGKRVAVEVLLITLGYSNYTLAVGLRSQKKEDLVEGLVDLFTQLEAVSAALVPDNLKSAVTTPDRYEPVINETFLDMANHYGMAVLPARPLKPKDKAKVETHVNVLYQQVYARLRHTTFHSLQEVNEALREKVEHLNNAVMQDYGVSRKTLLERDERAHLKPLPSQPYALVKQSRPTVSVNGHVKISSIGKYLSVPYRLIGQKVTVLISNGIARIYHDRACVATHALAGNGLYVTQAEHMASAHREYLQSFYPDELKRRARLIGSEAESVIDAVLGKGLFPEQTYKTCQGILALYSKDQSDRFRQCCRWALANNMTSLRYMKHLMGSRHVNFKEEQHTAAQLPLHDNIRGRQNYV